MQHIAEYVEKELKIVTEEISEMEIYHGFADFYRDKTEFPILNNRVRIVDLANTIYFQLDTILKAVKPQLKCITQYSTPYAANNYLALHHIYNYFSEMRCVVYTFLNQEDTIIEIHTIDEKFSSLKFPKFDDNSSIVMYLLFSSNAYVFQSIPTGKTYSSIDSTKLNQKELRRLLFKRKKPKSSNQSYPENYNELRKNAVDALFGMQKRFLNALKSKILS